MGHSIRIGTSGWNYKHWRRVFYPEGLRQNQWFAFYAAVFDTVEINNTFYRLPEASTFEQWRRQAPAGFLYAVKANRYLTHNLKLSNAGSALDRLLVNARRLQTTLGPLLYQLPPRWRRNVDRLKQFFRLLPKNLVHVLEFRDADWLTEETYELLDKHQVGLCIHDLLPDHPRRVTGKAAYVRFHGTDARYGGSYPKSVLRAWARWIQSCAEQHDVYVYFNNDVEGHAVDNARTLRAMLGC